MKKSKKLCRTNATAILKFFSFKDDTFAFFYEVRKNNLVKYYVNCNKKATPMRFASAYFDGHKADLQAIDSYDRLLKYLDHAGLEKGFLAFAKERDGLVPTASEWKIERDYMMTQVRALVGRYSKLGDNAFYHLYLSTDEVYKAAMAAL